MAIPHKRASILARLLRRCPECGKLGSLRMTQSSEGINGRRRDYTCRKCGTRVQDWKPADAVKF